MTTDFLTPEEKQQAAIHPKHHVWVSASAGTGKTKILTDRVLNLLIQGVNPRKILCLTFTNAAAAEMMQRLLDRLGQWACCSDDILRQQLTQLLNHFPSRKTQQRARRLFVEILELSKGFRIQTIHSFCQSLLVSFPLEADVATHATILTDYERDALVERVQESVLQIAQEDEDLCQSIKVLAEQFHTETFKSLCQTLLQERLKLLVILSSGVSQAHLLTYYSLGLESQQNAQELLNQWIENSYLKSSQFTLHQIALLLLEGKSSDQIKGQAILNWLESHKTPENFKIYAGHFLTSEGSVRQRLATRELVIKNPHLKENLEEESQRIYETFHLLNKLKIAEISCALLTLSHHLLQQYENFKKAHHVLDYDDLILKANILLHKKEYAPWILYKLDGGIDHLLIDEAQDTNTLQWSIIQALTEEFFSNEDDFDHPRTLFAVGDAKQSIYSFQGTDPEIFSAMRAHFTHLTSLQQKPWQSLEMSLSFRSTSVILDFVDTLFNDPIVKKGVVDEESLNHLCFRQGQAGKVELWPLVKSPKNEINNENKNNEDQDDYSPHTRILLAQHIAQQIENWFQEKKYLASQGRSIKAGDILVLVQKRTEFVPALIQNLKQKGIAVSGLDRLNLLEDLAIQDLMALGDFLLLPEDDYTLACVLKSPFCNLTEEDLFVLAAFRGHKSLWEILQEQQEKFPDVVERLTTLLNQVDFISPFALYSEILFNHHGLKKIISRLGQEALDPVEEFLSLAYDYHHKFLPSLQSFLHWVRQSKIEIKRDFSQAGSQTVRIMTVHGAKGLQAPIVILADTLSKPILNQDFLWNHENGLSFLWSPPKSLDVEETVLLKKHLKDAQDQEYRRLLYVALTRAEDQIYIGGAHEGHRSIEGSWYQLLEAALKPLAYEINLPWGKGLCFETKQHEGPASSTLPFHKTESFSKLPLWLTQSLNLQKEPKNDFEIHDLDMPQEKLLTAESEKEKLTYQLMKILPFLPEERWPGCLTLHQKNWIGSLKDFQETVKSIEKFLDHHQLLDHFKLAQKNIPVMGWYENKLYKGCLDCLFQFKEEIWVIDYNTSPSSATHPAHVKKRHQDQVKIYQAIIQSIYPNFKIKKFILWTKTLTLMEI